MSNPDDIDRDAVIRKLEAAFGPPHCPAGCGDARRPRCAFDLGAGCDRWDILESWEALYSTAVRYASDQARAGRERADREETTT